MAPRSITWVPSQTRWLLRRCSSASSTRIPRRFARSALGADGHANVVVVLEHDLVALDLRVDLRERLERADRRLDEERGDADADAEFLGEGFLVRGIQDFADECYRVFRFERVHLERLELSMHPHERHGARRDQMSESCCRHR